jgi:hypothetical protein
MKPNFLPVREFETIFEGFQACEKEGEDSLPFVVRSSKNNSDVKPNGTAWPTVEMIRRQLGKEKNIRGYACGKTVFMSGMKTLEQYDSSTMMHNVVDAESTRSSTSLLPQSMITMNETSRVEQENWLAYVVSPTSNTIGTLHCDPPFGSNWQYVAEGRKIWYTISPKNFDIKSYNSKLDSTNNDSTICKCTTKEEESKNEVNLVKAPPDMEKLSMTHDVYSVTIAPGDFISVPIFWPHAIQTIEKVLGLSGYSIIPNIMLSPRSETGDY